MSEVPPHSPNRSVYSISSDRLTPNPFDEDGDSFTSFGSIHTPPRLRSAIRQIFDGSLRPTGYASSDVGSSNPGSQHEPVSNFVPPSIIDDSLQPVASWLGETFGERRERLIAAARPCDQRAMSAVALSDQDGEYELDDSLDSRKDTSDPVEPMVTVDTTVATGLIEAYELGDKEPYEGPFQPTLGYKSMTELPSSCSSIDDDPSDPTYHPSKSLCRRSRLRSRRARFSGQIQAKPKPPQTRLRDAKGRFVAARSERVCKAPVEAAPSSDVSLPRPSTPCFSDHSELQRTALETATNMFLNTVLRSPNNNPPLTFEFHDPFQAHFRLASPPPPAIDPLLFRAPTVNLPPTDPRVRFRAAFLQLLQVLAPFLTGFSPLRDEWGAIDEITNAMYAAEDWYIKSVYFYPDVMEQTGGF
ncbi:hypothetical protein PtB15_4B793 [Puccinia triticina]|nr:hypothetical protein PtB15_4B793 [Puccinia triticina]